MMKTQINFLIAFLGAAIFLGMGAYLEIYQGLVPCALCLLQRIVLGMLGVLFLIGVAIGRKKWGQFIVSLLSLLIAILGILLSGRQIELQHLPAVGGANCEASLQYMLKVLPWDQVLKNVFEGGVACSHVNWTFWHLSLAQWSLLVFALFLVFSLWQMKTVK